MASEALNRLKFRCNDTSMSPEGDCHSTKPLRDTIRPYLDELYEVVDKVARKTGSIFITVTIRIPTVTFVFSWRVQMG